MSKVVVTGSNGFVGAKLCQLLSNNGHEVIGVDLTVSPHPTSYKQISLDFADSEFSELLDSATTLVHLASISTDGDCRNDPELAIDVNLLRLQKLKRIAEASNVKHFIFASSEWVYPEKEVIERQDEEYKISSNGLNSLYAVSKLVGEDIMRLEIKIPTTVLRFGIVYGPRVKPGSAPESLLQSVLHMKDIEVGNLDTARRFIFVDDLVTGIIGVIESEVEPGLSIYNLAGTDLISLRDVILTAQEITGSIIKFTDLGKSASIRNPISSKFENKFGWTPETGLKSGLSDCLRVMKASV